MMFEVLPEQSCRPSRSLEKPFLLDASPTSTHRSDASRKPFGTLVRRSFGKPFSSPLRRLPEAFRGGHHTTLKSPSGPSDDPQKSEALLDVL